MLKLVINYDMISRINEANGKYKLIRCYKRNYFTGMLATGNVIADIITLCNGASKPSKSISSIIFWLTWYFGVVPLIEHGVESIKKKHNYNTYKDDAIDDLKKLAQQLRNQNIDTTYENLLASEVYHRKYKLDMEGAPGIIRERYINIPTYDYNGLETTTSILEEHKIGSRKYVLTLGSPKKKTVLKPAFGMGM